MERVWHGESPDGLIDFDHARPAPPVFDIAYALEYAAPFRDDSECLRWLRYPQPPDRRRRIEIFCDAYGTAVPADITSRVAWQQRLVLQARSRSGPSGNEVVSSPSAEGIASAAASPWVTRAPRRTLADGASPPASDAAASRTSPARNSRRRPARSPSRPNSKVNPADGSANAVAR